MLKEQKYRKSEKEILVVMEFVFPGSCFVSWGSAFPEVAGRLPANGK